MQEGTERPAATAKALPAGRAALLAAGADGDKRSADFYAASELARRTKRYNLMIEKAHRAS